jgi:cysteine desulfurase
MSTDFTEKFGHPASRNHPFGWEAEGGVDKAREQIAKLIGARDPKEVVFTSGGTEAINLALKGVAEMYREKGNHIVTTTIEQRATLDVCKRLERQGFEVTYVPVGREGLVDVEAVRAALTDKTILISIMFANNEIGTIQPVAELGKLAKEKGIIFHTDATQAVGKVPVDVEAMGIDLLSMTAHMLYGPKGVGALYVRRKSPRVRLAPMVDGGGHERGMRSGTVPVPLVVGFGKAAEICREVMGEESKRLAALRDRLQEQIVSKVDEAYVNGHPDRRLPHNLNISFARRSCDGAQPGGGAASARPAPRRPSKIRVISAGGDSELAHLDPVRAASLLHRGRGGLRGAEDVEVIHRLRDVAL